MTELAAAMDQFRKVGPAALAAGDGDTLVRALYPVVVILARAWAGRLGMAADDAIGPAGEALVLAIRELDPRRLADHDRPLAGLFTFVHRRAWTAVRAELRRRRRFIAHDGRDIVDDRAAQRADARLDLERLAAIIEPGDLAIVIDLAAGVTVREAADRRRITPYRLKGRLQHARQIARDR